MLPPSGSFSWALEAACLDQRRKWLDENRSHSAPDTNRWQSLLSQLLEISPIAPAVQSMALNRQFVSPRDFVQWLLPALPVLSSTELNQLSGVLSELLQVEIRLMPANALVETTADTWNTQDLTIHVGRVSDQTRSDDSTSGLIHLLKEAQFQQIDMVPQLKPGGPANTNVQVLLLILDWLREEVQNTRISAENADRILNELRQIAEQLQYLVTPSFWTYIDDWTAKHLDERMLASAIYNFDNVRSLGAISGVKLGLSTDDSTIREPIVSISLGPVKEDIRDCVLQGMSTIPAELGALREAIRTWGRHIVQGTFRDELIEFYTNLHSQPNEFWQKSKPGEFQKFRDLLHEVLRLQFGIQPFFPTRRDEYQRHWTNVVGHTAAQTGRVRRVIQPGLLDAQDRLITPARVEVD